MTSFLYLVNNTFPRNKRVHHGEPKQRAHSPQPAAGLASEYKN